MFDCFIVNELNEMIRKLFECNDFFESLTVSAYFSSKMKKGRKQNKGNRKQKTKKQISDEEQSGEEENEKINSNIVDFQNEEYSQIKIDLSPIQIPIPMKIKCPFENNGTPFKWEENITKYLKSFSFLESSHFSREIFQEMSSLNKSKVAPQVEEFLKEKIPSIVKKNITKLTDSAELSDFVSKIRIVNQNINLISVLFQTVFLNIQQFIISLFKENLLNQSNEFFLELIASIVSELSDNKENDDIYEAIHFFIDFSLFTDEINDQFTRSFLDAINSKKQDKSKSNINDSLLFYATICQVFPPAIYNHNNNCNDSILEILTSITDAYINKIIKSDLSSLISSISPVLTSLFTDIYNFVYSTSDPNYVINEIINYYEQERLDLDEVINNFRLFSNFMPSTIMKIGRAVRKSLRPNDETIATKYAEIIDQKFRNDDYNENYNLANEMSLIQKRDAFEAIHSSLMLRRSLQTSMICDQRFTNEYRMLYGSHATRFESILQDFYNSNILVEEFCSLYEIPSYLHIFILYSCNWSLTYRRSMRFPSILHKIMTNFSEFFKKKNPNKIIEWSLSLSSCEVQINGITIKCNGIVAAIIYSLLKKERTAQEISDEICLDLPETQRLLKILGSSKCGKFVRTKDETYYINKESSPPDNLIDLPLYLLEDRNIEMDRKNLLVITSTARQIDSSILNVLKGDQTIKKSILFERVQERLQFTLDHNTFEERLLYLEKRRFLKKGEERNTIIFIP